jgi:hypothetical protein
MSETIVDPLISRTLISFKSHVYKIVFIMIQDSKIRWKNLSEKLFTFRYKKSIQNFFIIYENLVYIIKSWVIQEKHIKEQKLKWSTKEKKSSKVTNRKMLILRWVYIKKFWNFNYRYMNTIPLNLLRIVKLVSFEEMGENFSWTLVSIYEIRSSSLSQKRWYLCEFSIFFHENWDSGRMILYLQLSLESYCMFH